MQIRVPRSALRAHASADASDALASQETISLLELAANMDDDARALAYWSTLFMMVEHFHNEATSDGSGLADRSPEHAARWSRMGELVAEARTGLSIANRRLDPDAAIAAVDPARTYSLIIFPRSTVSGRLRRGRTASPTAETSASTPYGDQWSDIPSSFTGNA